MDALRMHMRHAGRSLRRNPGFSAAAVLTLGLGIGAVTAISLEDLAVYGVILGGVALVHALVALAASWLPARRASRVDPMIALRSE